MGADGAYTVSGKAANGEGSLYRERDGAWRATYRVPGESRPRRVRGRTREEALRRRADAMATAIAAQPRSLQSEGFTAANTIAEFSAWWLTTIAAVRVRPSSLGRYKDRVRRITAYLGDVRIGSLRAERVATWQAELLEELAAKTVATRERRSMRSVPKQSTSAWSAPTQLIACALRSE